MSNTKVLVVDDEAFIRQLMHMSLEELEDEGVEILTADNGQSALDIIRAEHPRLVYLDVMMPRMNGFDVCEVVKHELQMRDVYIVLLTAKGQEYDRQRGAAAGADLYWTKPFDPDTLLQKAREVLGLV
ncbi:MAG: response regulator [Anaerolineae bacterium]|nr:response regulator [Anaerolineae bacterium]